MQSLRPIPSPEERSQGPLPPRREHVGRHKCPTKDVEPILEVSSRALTCKGHNTFEELKRLALLGTGYDGEEMMAKEYAH